MRRICRLGVLFFVPAAALLWGECAHAALPPGAQPLPAGPEVYVGRDFAQAALKWNLNTTVEAYQRVGLKSPAWDEAALRLLDMSARIAAGVDDPPSEDELLAAAEQVRAAGCSDPLVLHTLGWISLRHGKATQSEAYLRRAVEGYRTVKYPRSHAWLAPLCLAEACQDLGGEQQKEVDQWLDLATQWVAEAAAEGPFAPYEQRVLWRDLANTLRLGDGSGANVGLLKSRGKLLYEALAANPHADPWIVHMAEASYLSNQAWEARGGDWAVSVTEQGWRDFKEGLTQARPRLLQAWELHPEYPEAATEMMSLLIGLGTERSEIRRWFDRAVAGQFDWSPAYDCYVWALRPRWGGSHEEMYDFGLECLATKRFDTCVPQLLYQILLAITEEEANTEFWQRPGLYANLQTLFTGLLAEPRRVTEQTCWKSVYAAVAWRCGYPLDARPLLDELGEQVVATAFTKDLGVPLALAKGEVLADTGPLGARVRATASLEHRGEIAAALPLFEKLAAECTDPGAVVYLQDRVIALQRENALAQGEWVDLTPSEDFAGWQKVLGKWALTEDGAIEATPGSGGALLLCNMRVPDAYEIRVDLELPSAPSSAEGGIVVGYWRGGTPYWTTVGLCRDRGEARVAEQFYDAGADRKASVALQDRNQLLVQVRNYQVTVYLNGTRILSDQKMAHGYAGPPGNQVGLGGWAWFPSAGVVRYRNLQVHRLTY